MSCFYEGVPIDDTLLETFNGLILFLYWDYTGKKQVNDKLMIATINKTMSKTLSSISAPADILPSCNKYECM